MWKFQASYEYDAISLHDCRITNIATNGSNIILNFADGYWISQTNPQNPYGKTLKTDASCLVLVGGDCKDIVFGGKKFSWDEFCSNINSEKWNFECITECYSDNKLVYAGWIWIGERYHQPNPECHIWLEFQSLIYNWDIICEGRQW